MFYVITDIRVFNQVTMNKKKCNYRDHLSMNQKSAEGMAADCQDVSSRINVPGYT